MSYQITHEVYTVASRRPKSNYVNTLLQNLFHLQHFLFFQNFTRCCHTFKKMQKPLFFNGIFIY